MKKLIAVLTMLAVCVSSSAYAAVGDVAGKVVYTDISAYINHYPIPAYAYDGGMVQKFGDCSEPRKVYCRNGNGL